jgi:hypothetical protein
MCLKTCQLANKILRLFLWLPTRLNLREAIIELIIFLMGNILMPYSYPSRVPRVAKNWTEPQKKRCTAAAQSVLENKGTEREAIFACIHAAGVRKKQEPDEYDRACEDASLYFQHLLELYYEGELDIDEFESRFKSGLEEHYARLMLLALGTTREVTEDDLYVLKRRLEKDFGYLDGFVEDISTGRMTQPRALWRAGLYGWNRGTFVHFTVPADVIGLMPVLPGDDCLGGSACKCGLNTEVDSDGTIYVYWNLDPLAESCPICIAHSIESPFVFTLEDQNL